MKNDTVKQSQGSSVRYEFTFPEKLRELMEENGTTQKELAAYVGIRPQSLSLYLSGETQPNGDKLLKIAEYYSVSVDYLLTGTRTENAPVRDMLGLSEYTVQNMKLIKDGYFEDAPYMLPMLDALLGNKDFYLTLEHAAVCKQAAIDATGEQAEFYEWKAAQGLESFFLEFLSRNLKAIYHERKQGD